MAGVRLYTGQALEIGAVVRLEAAPARHLVRVLRRRPGDRAVLFNGDGYDYRAEIMAGQGRGECCLEIIERHAAGTESPLAVTLVQAVGKGERMDWCIQKSVELGVTAICPVFTERTEVRLDQGRADKRRKRWREIVIAACEQCGRAVVPEVALPAPLYDLRPGCGTRLFLHPDGDLSPGGLAAPSEGAICLAVGPEGDFSGDEIGWLDSQGFAGVALGPRVLRTETAGPAALAVLQARFGDLG